MDCVSRFFRVVTPCTFTLQNIYPHWHNKKARNQNLALNLLAPRAGLPSINSGQAHLQPFSSFNFLSRLHPLICRSRWAAENLSLCISEYSSFAPCCFIRCSIFDVIPVYSCPSRSQMYTYHTELPHQEGSRLHWKQEFKRGPLRSPFKFWLPGQDSNLQPSG
jgi:hypothetical protein